MPSHRPDRSDFDAALARLGAVQDGAAFLSLSSWVGRVRYRGAPAFLKVTREPEELAGVRALQAWGGNGAVRVLAVDDDATVLERAGRTLHESIDDDADATSILCDVVERLHRASPPDLTGFVPMRRWFRDLFTDTDARFDRARAYADELVDTGPAVLLHGDIHHENVLDGGARGWLAIDPKALAGPAPFDYCNLFTNWTPAESVARFDERLATVRDRTGIERDTLLRWIAAWSALSGIWMLQDGDREGAAYPHLIMGEALARL